MTSKEAAYTPDGKTLYHCPKHIGRILTIPEGVERIRAFSICGCDDLTTIILPKSLIEIDTHAIIQCYNLESVILYDGVEHIASWAFFDCKSLRHLFIPTSVKKIGAEIALNCSSEFQFFCEGEIEEAWDKRWNRLNQKGKAKLATVHKNVPRWWYDQFITQNK